MAPWRWPIKAETCRSSICVIKKYWSAFVGNLSLTPQNIARIFVLLLYVCVCVCVFCFRTQGFLGICTIIIGGSSTKKKSLRNYDADESESQNISRKEDAEMLHYQPRLTTNARVFRFRHFLLWNVLQKIAVSYEDVTFRREETITGHPKFCGQSDTIGIGAVL